MTLSGLLPLVVLAALGFWTALLVNRGIAVFHDGMRPAMGEFAAGRMAREDLVEVWKSLSQSFTVWFIPIGIGTGLMLGHLLFIPTDYLGVRARSWWIAGLFGAIAGAGIGLALIVARTLLAALPVDMTGAIYRSLGPLVYGVTIIPAVAAGYQFGWISGVVTLVAIVIGYVVNLMMANFPPNVLPILAGLLVLAYFAYRAAQKQADDDFAFEPLELKADRVRQNWPWLAVQGALVALAVNMLVFTWFPLDAAITSYGFRVEVALVTLMITIGFLPTVSTASSLTGVASVIGLTWVFTVAYLAPHPLIAAALGAAVMTFDAMMLGRINAALDRTPILREIGDSMRGALEHAASFAMIGGAFIVGTNLLPSGAGVLIVAAFVALNELTGWRVMRLAVGPVAVVLVGIMANVFYVLGVAR